MKKKTIAVMLGLMMTTTQFSPAAVFAETEQTSTASPETGSLPEKSEGAPKDLPADPEMNDERIYGEVTAVEDGSVTIAVGTLRQNDSPSQQPPAKPEGEAPSMTGNGQPPEMPDGQAPDMNGTEMPDGQNFGGMPGAANQISLEKTGEEMTLIITEDTVITTSSSDHVELKVGDIVAVTLEEDGTAAAIEVQTADSNGNGGPGGMGDPGQGGPDGMGAPGQGGPGGMGAPGQGGPGGQASGVDSYDAVNEYSESIQLSGETIESTGSDENAVLVDSSDAEVVISDSKITRNSSDSTGGDTSSFYGVGAALLATDGTLSVNNSTIDTDAAGGAGIFAYGDGVVYASDDAITTAQGTSGGIHVAGGGTLYAWDLNVTTQGGSSAAIRSDRGSGTMVIDGGSYTSNGSGSPAIYSTADITVHDADLTATGSEAVCIEGLNTIRLYDCDLTGNMPENEQNDVTWNVIVYQSMSGDSKEGNGTFQMEGGTLTAQNGGMFYTTNTESTITLKDVEINYSNENPFFLQVTGNANARGWGSTGSNGADCLFTAMRQDMQGDVIWDSISQLDFYMTEGSSLTGAFINDETWAGQGGSGYSNLYIDASSVWTVTADSTLTSLHNEGTIVDTEGNTVSVVGTDGTVYVEGTGSLTVTVDSYEASADVSGASTIESFDAYAVEKQ